MATCKYRYHLSAFHAKAYLSTISLRRLIASGGTTRKLIARDFLQCKPLARQGDVERAQ